MKSLKGSLRRGLCYLLPITIVGSGCQQGSNPFLDRFNHVHNEDLLKRIDKASGDFDTFTGEEGGFTDQLVNNVTTDSEFNAAANAVRADVDDKLRSFLTSDITWRQLRQQIYTDLGVPAASVDGTLIEPEFELAERVSIRQLKVAAIVRALTLLAQAQDALLAHAKQDAELAKTALQKAQDAEKAASATQPVGKFPTTSPTATPTDQQRQELKCKRVQWVIDLYAAVETAGVLLKENKELLATATEQQRALLAQLRDSADPASAKALIALLGTGLRDLDFDLLDAYLAYLDDEIQDIAPPAGRQPEHGEDRLVVVQADALHGVAVSPESPADERAWAALNANLLETQLLLGIARQATLARLDSPSSTAGKTRSNAVATNLTNVIRGYGRGLINKPEMLASKIAQYDRAKRFVQELPEALEQPPAPQKPNATPAAKTVPHKETLRQRLLIRSSLDSGIAPARPGEIAKLNWSGTTQPVLPPNPQQHFFIRAQGLQVKSAKTEDKKPFDKALNSLVENSQVVESALKALKISNSADLIDLVSQRLNDVITSLGKHAFALQDLVKGDASSYVALLSTALQKKAEGGDDGCMLQINSATTTNNQLAGVALFGLVLRANPSLQSHLADLLDSKHHGTEFAAAMDQVGKMVNEGLQQVLDARVRIRQFMNDLAVIQVDLASENVRHTTQMLTLADLELKRWKLLGQLLDQYSVTYDPDVWLHDPSAGPSEIGNIKEDWTSAATPQSDPRKGTSPLDQTWRIRLFSSDDIKDGRLVATNFYTALRNALDPSKKDDPAIDDWAPPNVPPARLPPLVKRDDRVLISIRKLADVAREFHSANQSDADPLGWNLTRANVRLQKAVALVDGSILLLSINEHLARENGVRVRKETSLHSVRLDSFERRTYEAGYRLTLGDLKAFHATGITDADLKAIESAALVFLGIRAN
jgi:hypothetical protein